jgi:hypothetical protein
MDQTSPTPATDPQHGTPHTSSPYVHQSGQVPPGVPGGWPSTVGTPMPAPSKKGLGGLAVSLIAVGSLAVGCIGGGIVTESGGGTVSAPVATTTVTAPAEAAAAAPAAAPAAEETPTEEPTPDAPKPSDFKLKVQTITKECFGSAGCIVTYRVKPTWSKAYDPDTTYTVSYKLTGGEDPAVGSFEVTGDTASYDSENSIQTPSSSSVLKAKPTQVLES